MQKHQTDGSKKIPLEQTLFEVQDFLVLAQDSIEVFDLSNPNLNDAWKYISNAIVGLQEHLPDNR